MNDEQYLQYCRGLFEEFSKELQRRADSLQADDPLRALAADFASHANNAEQFYESVPLLVKRLFTTYPELAPLFPRQLLWFFGGDCLHLMPDEEIERFQDLEEMRLAAAARGETFNLRDARAKLLNLQ